MQSRCLVVLILLGISAAYVSTAPAAQIQPKLLRGSSTGGAILTGPDMRPKRVAIAHCAQYKKHAVLRNLERVGESVATPWGSRAYIYHFDCM